MFYNNGFISTSSPKWKTFFQFWNPFLNQPTFFLAVKVREMRLVSVYQPHSGLDAEEIDYRREVEEQIERSGPEKVLVVGGEPNAHVGVGRKERETVRGRSCIGRKN